MGEAIAGAAEAVSGRTKNKSDPGKEAHRYTSHRSTKGLAEELIYLTY